MNKRISMGLCVSLIIMAVTATFAITMVSSKQIYNTIINNLALRSQLSDTIDEIDKIVSNYFYGTVEDKSTLINSSLVEGYVNGLDDPGSRYLTAEEYDEYLSLINGGLAGIGIETYYDSAAGKLIISYVYDKSPAQSAGLKQNDIIVSVADVPVSRYNYEALRQELYGEMLSSVKIVYQRDGKESSAEPMLGFSIPSVTGSLIETTGYIRITGFYKTTAAALEEMVDALRDKGATSFVFDVRNTSEGTIDYAAQTIDAVVSTSSGNIAVARTKSGEIYNKNGEKKYVAGTSRVSEPVVVLANNKTSGPAELFACDLRDMRAAKIVGTTTAGVGTMQDVFTLEDGGAVLLTVAVIEPNKGESGIYDGVGVEPTESVSLSMGENADLYLLTREQDNQLAKALELLAA